MRTTTLKKILMTVLVCVAFVSFFAVPSEDSQTWMSDFLITKAIAVGALWAACHVEKFFSRAL